MTERTKAWQAKDRRMAISGSVPTGEDCIRLLQRLGVPAVLLDDGVTIKFAPTVTAEQAIELQDRFSELQHFTLRVTLHPKK